MIAGLGAPWSAVRVFQLLPRGIADRLYEFVARNRLRIAGRRATCFVPTPEQRSRFLG